MLNIHMEVDRGIPFFHLEGELDNKNFKQLGDEINYLLYQQGFHYFVFDFSNLNLLGDSIYNTIKSKLIEILLSCGRVVLCGLSHKDRIGYTKDQLYYVEEKQEAFKYLYL